MAAKLTIKEMYARYEAFDEASQHLLMEWTDDKTERQQGIIVSKFLKNEADKWFRRAREAEKLTKTSGAEKT